MKSEKNNLRIGILKKCLSSLVAFIFAFTGCFMINVPVYAAGSYTINGKTVRYTDFSSSPNDCWNYANNIYNKIWGCRFSSVFSSDDNMLRNLSDNDLTLTTDHLKEYVSNAALGSSLRVCDAAYLHGNDGWGHSQIIVQKDANGFTVLEGGLSTSPYCREKYYTWSGYSKTYSYIKYIKWPGAPAYSRNKDTIPPTISNYKVSNLSKDGFTVSCTVTDNVAVSQVNFLVYPDENGNWSYRSQSATISGNTASCYVKTSEHHNYEGNYAVHVQAYDTSGNVAYGQFGWIYVDRTAPTISDFKVSNVTRDGFEVSCTVNDDKEIGYVDFLVWPDANGDWNNTVQRATISGNTASCYVKTSEHHNYEGNYAVHVQAYDAAGNMEYGRFPWIYVDRTAPIISDVEIVDVSETGYTVKCNVTDDHSKIDRVQFPTWYEDDNPYAVVGGWETSSFCSGKYEDGKYVYRVNISDYGNRGGKYHTHIYAYDECGNQSECYITETSIKKDHKHEYTSKIKKAATCTEDGIMLYTCKDNDDSYEEVIPATGHQNTELRNVKSATCASEGYTGDTYCKDCNAKLSTGKTIAKKAHDWGAGKVTTKATCTKKGMKTYTCNNCNATKTEELPMTNHATKVTKFVKEASCESSGYTGDIYCQDCGVLLEKGQTIPKLNHDWDVGKVTTKATCTTKGIKTYTCSNCNATKTEELPMTNHATKVTKFVKEASCESSGYTGDIYCQDCGTLLEEGQVIPKLNHSWDAGKITIKATTTSEGQKKFTCKRCNITRIEKIAKLPVQNIIGKTINDKSSNGIYKVLKNNCVEFIKPLSKKTSANIPDTVKINGKLYKVITISANAFKGNTLLKTVTIGKNITSIKSNAFYGCKNLKSITIKTSSLQNKNVGAKAFTGTNKKPTVKVPAKQLKSYKKLLQSKGMSKQAIYKK